MNVVQKYGGSSVATTEKIKNIASYIRSIYTKDSKIVIVVSAMGKTTNNLISLANEITLNPNKREYDALISTGELVSSSLLAMALCELGVPAISLSGAQAGIRTDSFHSRAFISSIEPDRLNYELSNHRVVIVSGFQGVDTNNDITTLGRGGSDTTAVAIAAVLSFPCEIYTDVDAVYSIDPRLYEKAKTIHNISYEEMMEMSVQGAKVLETRCIELAKKYNVPLYLGKTLETNKNKGTYVMNKTKQYFEQMIISGLSVKDNYNICTIKANSNIELKNVLNVISSSSINLEMISEFHYDNYTLFSFGSSSKDINTIIESIKSLNIYCKTTNNFVKLSLTGAGFSTHTQVCKKLFELLIKNNIEFQKMTMSEMSISFLINNSDKETAIQLISKEFDL